MSDLVENPDDRFSSFTIYLMYQFLFFIFQSILSIFYCLVVDISGSGSQSVYCAYLRGKCYFK